MTIIRKVVTEAHANSDERGREKEKMEKTEEVMSRCLNKYKEVRVHEFIEYQVEARRETKHV